MSIKIHQMCHLRCSRSQRCRHLYAQLQLSCLCPYEAHHLCQLVLPSMKTRPRGDIVMISSVATLHYGAGGAPYNMGKAALEAPANRFAWQHWRAEVGFPQNGYYEIWARATDSAGRSQPMVLPGWNPKGYLNNACHRIAVKVV